MKEVMAVIEKAREDFRKQLHAALNSGGLTPERYERFLSMQYHLTNGVQKHFFAVAAHPDMVAKKALRKFLLGFGDEEESHYLIAKKDLDNSDLKLLPPNLDVKLWWSFFNGIVQERPFVRLGATCVLENIGVGSSDLVQKLLAGNSFFNARNTRFVVIHQHEELPHGSQIIEALEGAHLSAAQWRDLVEGAQIGHTMYLRLFDWVLWGKEAAMAAA